MIPRTTRYYLVRHGVTSWNREMRFQGHTDVPLGTEGLEQARRIAARLALVPEPPVALYSSDLSRARVTAEAIAVPHGLTVQTTPLLRETCLGEWEGLNRAEIVARGDEELLDGYIRDSHRYRPPGGESLESVSERMLRAWEEIRATNPPGPVVIVGHGGSLRALLCAALDAPVASMRRLWLDNTALSIIEEHSEAAEERRRILLLNDTSHLAGMASE